MRPPDETAELRVQRAFSSLPLELFLNVLDQLVGTRDGRQPIAYALSDPVTKALRALTLVSRDIYPVASRYLYANCLYLDNCTNYARFRRTFGLNLGNHPQALKYGQAGRNDRLFNEADVPKHITSLFLSPQKTEKCGDSTPMIRLPQIIDICNTIGPTLRRLAIDLQPVYAPASEIQLVKPHMHENNIFLRMPGLEELICSFDVTDYFTYPPPNLKKLAITIQEMEDAHVKFCFSISSLDTLVTLRPPELDAFEIGALFNWYKGHHLDVILVDVSANHGTPKATREWKPDDTVKIWEVDVPKSYYGDENDLILCDGWIWRHGVRGTLWDQHKRRMKCWKEIERNVAKVNPQQQQYD